MAKPAFQQTADLSRFSFKNIQYRQIALRIRDYFLFKDIQLTANNDLSDFARDADNFMLSQKPVRAVAIIRISLLALILFVLWAAITHVDELVKSDGKVVPSSQLQVLQSLDGGVIQEILVREGEAVKSGQELIKIDNTRFVSSVKEGEAQHVALLAKSERLNALLEDREFATPAELSADEQLVFAQEQRYAEAAKSELSSQISIAQEQLSQRRQELGEARSKRDLASQMLDSASHEYSITKPLLGSGAISEVDLIRLQRDITRFKGEQAQASAQIARAEASIKEASQKIESVEVGYRNNLRKELSETSAKLNSLSESVVGLRDKVKQSVIRSPMDGHVNRLLYNTIGGVVTAGKDIIEIVPSEDNLLLEAKIQPRDIAFLKVGQKALVKFTAYDFSIYGGMDATLVSIGSDSISDEKQNVYYLVKLRTGSTELKDGLEIIPGMQAEINILTGSKSILTYLLKPIIRAKQIAFTER